MRREKALSWFLMFLIALVVASLIGVEVLVLGFIVHTKEGTPSSHRIGSHK